MSDYERFQRWKLAMLEYLGELPRADHPRILEALDKRDEANPHVRHLLSLFCSIFLDPSSRHEVEDANRFWTLDGRAFTRWTVETLRSRSEGGLSSSQVADPRERVKTSESQS